MAEDDSFDASACLLTGIASLEARVSQDANAGVHRTYTLKTLPRIEPCAVPECIGGGLDLHVVARCVDSGAHHFYCMGYKYGPRGEPGAQPCSNHFELQVRVVRVSAVDDERTEGRRE